MKYISAHQPQFFPHLSFFEKISCVDTYVCLDTLKYSRHSFQTRNKIKIDSDTGWTWIFVPIKYNSDFYYFDQYLIDNTTNWKKKHLKSIQLAYSKSKYFEEIFEDLKKIYSKEHIRLSDIVLDIIYYGIKTFEIKTDFILYSEMLKDGFKPKESKGLWVLELTKYLNGTKFLFGENATNYLTDFDKESFKKNNVEFVFQKYEFKQYPQLHGSFVPALSFTDLLFNIGKEDGAKFLRKPWRFRKL
tara:strand:- start:344 stop:1078 length:735 start_codon:yes stop_codon:yes gene_type:complete